MRPQPLGLARLALLVALCPVLTGCFSAALSRQDATAARSVLIVPIEPPPAFFAGYDRAGAAGIFLAGGALGLAAHEAATRDERRDAARQINALMRDWRMD